MAKPKKKTGFGDGNIEQVRDILFGQAMEEFRGRFEDMEERLAKEISQVRADVKKKFDNFEIYVKKELNSLDEQIKAEASNRDEADSKILSEKDLLAKKLSAFEAQSNKTHSDIRSQILDLTKKTGDELSEARKELTEALNRAESDLQFQKTDRSKLASLFTELAIRLSDEGVFDEDEFVDQEYDEEEEEEDTENEEEAEED